MPLKVSISSQRGQNPEYRMLYILMKFKIINVVKNFSKMTVLKNTRNHLP